MFKKSFFLTVHLLFVYFVFTAVNAYAVTTFTLTVPQRNSPGPITNIHLIVDVRRTTAAPGTQPTITLVNTAAGGGTFTFSPGVTEPPDSGGDNVVANTPPVPPGVLPAAVTRHRFNLALFSDYDEENLTCANQMTTPNEVWNISVSAGFDIIAACPLSFYKPACASNTLVTGDVMTGPAASVAGGGGASFAGACERFRPGTDVVMVLDKSGSMSDSTMGITVGRPNRPKIEALRDAVTDFVGVWNGLRTLEADATYRPSLPPADNVGVVLFESDAAWWPVLPVGLNSFTTANGTITSNVGSITPGSATSIGDGLFEADATLTSADAARRRTILLMSDGMQNTDRLVGINGANRVITHPFGNPAAGVELANQDKYDIYSVTVGTSTAVSADINQQVANRTGGFYINSEDQAELLRPFFLELLQNFLKFNTYQTVRMISQKATRTQAFTAEIPLTSTTETLSINLMWTPQQVPLRLTAVPPGGGAPIVMVGSGPLRINRRLSSPQTASGSWKVTVEVPDFSPRIAASTGAREVPFDLFVIADDHGLDVEQSIAPGDYVPGNRIRLRTKATAFGRPVKNIGAGAGDRVVAELLRPGVGIGDMLSQSNASGNANPQSTDASNAADTKLQNTLRQNPDALVRATETIAMFDNGSAANGDDVAGDGIYSALYEPQIPGHYNFLFGLQGSTAEVGRFSRQQLKTVFVRAVPDAANTAIQAALQERNTLVIRMTPRTRFNHRMGPGFANYFWFTAPGVTPFKAIDNLDGTYTAQLPFNGVPPRVSVHFIDRPIFIDDTVTPDKLPVPLNDGNEIIDNVTPRVTPTSGGVSKFALLLGAGAGIPHDNFNNFFDPGFSGDIGLEYIAASTFSVVGQFGYHRFGTAFSDHLNLYRFSVNGRVYGGSAPVRPFFNFGGGVYHFDSGDTHGGANVGGGLQFDLTNRFAVEGLYNFHSVFTPGTNVKFSTVQGGVRFRF